MEARCMHHALTLNVQASHPSLEPLNPKVQSLDPLNFQPYGTLPKLPCPNRATKDSNAAPLLQAALENHARARLLEDDGAQIQEWEDESGVGVSRRCKVRLYDPYKLGSEISQFGAFSFLKPGFPAYHARRISKRTVLLREGYPLQSLSFKPEPGALKLFDTTVLSFLLGKGREPLRAVRQPARGRRPRKVLSAS